MTPDDEMRDAMEEQDKAILQCANLLSDAETELSHVSPDTELVGEIRSALARRRAADNEVIRAVRELSKTGGVS